MSLFTWLRNPTSIRSGRGRRPHLPAAPRFQPRLETLEGRRLPSTLAVLNTADNGPGSLRAEIAAAQSGDKIGFDPSLAGQTINLTSGELAINQSLDIEGPGGNNPPVSVGGNGSRAFDITNPGANVILAQLVIEGGAAAQGGGIYDAGATLSLSHDALMNAAQGASGAVGSAGGDALGGNIYQAGGNLSISHCNLEGAAYGGTGGVGAPGGAVLGGNIYSAGGVISIADSSVSSTTLGGTGTVYGPVEGACIYDAAGTSATISNTAFTPEVTAGAILGGAIYQAGGSLTATGCTFSSDNLAAALPGTGVFGPVEGGFIYEAGGAVGLTKSTFEYTQVIGGTILGGAIYQAGGVLSITNSDFANMYATSYAGGLAAGGALYVAAGATTIQNCNFNHDLAYGLPYPLGYPAGEGIGGAIYIAGGSVCISSNTTFASDFASTSNPDIFGPYTIC
jgi:hypothetical protein